MQPTYFIHAKDERVLAVSDCILAASGMLHRIEEAETITRASDGVLLVTKYRVSAPNFIASLWRASA